MQIPAKIKQKGDSKKVLNKILKSLSDKDILVGVPRDAPAYPDGTSVAQVAAKHEFGSAVDAIPERSFLRTAIAENTDNYIKMASKGGKKVVDGTLSMDNLLSLIGLQAETDVRDKITNLTEPPLSPRTVAKRKDKSDNPLVDTGHLRRSIRYEIRGRV
jgi:hypothetical protein